MPDTTPVLQLPYILPSQAQKHVTHNEAIRLLDVIVQLSVAARNLPAPPAAPAQGDRYIVPAGATGGWAGQGGKIALFENGAWQFFTPLAGWTAWVVGEQALASYTGNAWVSQADGPFNVGQLGISATPDSVNRLSVSAQATLLNHAGAGHQLKLNKAGAGDTASLLFQTGFSGRAEMGTMGSDDFAVKVSADGSAFVTGLSIAANTGQVTLPAAARLGGQAVDPIAPPNGTIWLNTTTGEVKLRSAGDTVVFAAPPPPAAALASLGVTATADEINRIADIAAPPAGHFLVGDPTWNFALGAAETTNSAFWAASETVGGVTFTRVSSDINPVTGNPRVVYDCVGTLSTPTAGFSYISTAWLIAGVLGESWTVSTFFEVLGPSGGGAGTAQIGNGLRVFNVQTGASNVLGNSVAGGRSLSSATRTLTISGNQRVGIQLHGATGQAINARISIEGFQMEKAAARGNARYTHLTPAQARAALGNVPTLDQNGRLPATALVTGQTWQNVTSSRVLGTTYTNSTGREIMACISWNSTSFAGFEVGGVTVMNIASAAVVGTSTIPIPVGATYRTTLANGFSHWAELR